MNGIHNLDFQLSNGGGGLFAPNLKINEVNLNAMAALLASSDGFQSNGMEDGTLSLFGSQPQQNPFYNYLHQNLFANGLKAGAAGQPEVTPAMMLQNAGIASGNLNNLNGFDKIDSLNSLFKPTNGNMLGK